MITRGLSIHRPQCKSYMIDLQNDILVERRSIQLSLIHIYAPQMQQHTNEIKELENVFLIYIMNLRINEMTDYTMPIFLHLAGLFILWMLFYTNYTKNTRMNS